MAQDVVFDLPFGVHYKDTNGSLTLYTDRVSWKSIDSYNPDLVIKYIDIRIIKQNPENKDNLLLKLILNDETSHVFKFSSKNTNKDVENRVKTKSFLAKLNSASKNTPTSDFLSFEQKNKFLSTDSFLFKLYNELVVTKLMAAEDFWFSVLVQRDAKIESSRTLTKPIAEKQGVPSDFWSSLTPVSKGCNEISLNLNTDCINSIFLTYPNVKIKFDEIVPSQISDVTFWTQFFQALYYYRDKKKTKRDMNDIFLNIFYDAETKFNSEVKTIHIPTTLDLNDPASLPQGYGLEIDEDEDTQKFACMSKINRQSRTILKTFQENSLILESICDNPFKSNTDLMYEIEPYSQSITTTQIKPPIISDLKVSTTYSGNVTNPMIMSIDKWRLKEFQINFPSKSVVSDENQNFSLDDDSRQQLSLYFRVFYELLRLFWMCFPVNPSTLPKLHKSVISLDTYYNNTFQPWMSEKQLINVDSHINQMVNIVKSKYAQVCRTKK